jgi:hypothetical protein
MALSMDEQRMLAEIERRLAAEDPGLAAKLSSFRRPGPAARLRSPRGKVLGSLFAVAVVAVISVTVYAMIPFRVHSPKSATSPQASGQASVTAPAKVGSAKASTVAKASTAARTNAIAGASTVKTSTARTSIAARVGATRPATAKVSIAKPSTHSR